MRFVAMLWLFLIYATPMFAEPLDSDTHPSFNIKKANQQFDHINLQLSVQNLDINNLEAAINTLTILTSKADNCIDDTQKTLTKLDMLVKQADLSGENKTTGADLVYLHNQQKLAADKQSQCRLFSIRAKEAISVYKIAVAKLIKAQTFAHSSSLWTIINQLILAPPETKLIEALTTQIPDALPPLLYSIFFLAFAWMSSFFILKKVKKSQFSRQYLRFRALHSRHLMLLTALFGSAGLFTYFILFSQDLSSFDISLDFSALLFGYLSLFTLITFLFKTKTVRAVFYWYSLDPRFFQSLSITSLSFYITSLIAQSLSNLFNTNSPLWQLCQSLFLCMTLATSVFFVYYFCHEHPQFSSIRHHRKLIQRTVALLSILCALCDTLGYQALAEHLTYSGFMTFSVVFAMLLMTQGIHKVYLILTSQPTTKAKVIKFFGYRADQVFTEFLILKTVAQLIVIAISIYLIGEEWEFLNNFVEGIYDQILHGVHVLNMTIYPTRIVSGVVVFCLLYLLFQAISTAISRNQQFENEEETQVAVASILTYIGFSIALITGLLMAGFDFTGLAIIAGALSVGIGLGLQSIVNNFVSGIILLIEKPIRPGDRINVDDIEGFVKKIRVRSTQITTPSREDIIVPNSDLITRRVTNYMFSDKFGRISCDVNVLFGNPPELVREVLLDVANQHEEVIRIGRNKPAVLLASFTNGSLLFTLTCLIKDVNKKSLVKSELNFAIEKAFRTHHIEMPSCQNELHLSITELSTLAKQLKSVEALDHSIA